MRISVASALALAAAALVAGAPPAHAAIDDTVRDGLEFAEQRLRATAPALPADRYPAGTAATGAWATTGPRAWTSGFFPGTLWQLYGASGDPFFRTQGEARLGALESQRRDTSGNDQGFKLLGSFGNAHRLTGNDGYRRVVLRGARSLASRYGPVAGATRSWGRESSPDFTVIVDNLMNLELLFWAARHGGNPAWHAMALSHALRTMRDHVRGDGSTFHVVDYSPRNGRVKGKRTRQGHARDSTWSRGQAWAVYGFAMAYRETGDARLLDTARRVADWFIAHLPPDRVPYWDFDAPGIPGAPRDSSAASIAASGLLELAVLEPDPARAEGYRDSAEATIASLSTPAYLGRGKPTQALLLHGTQDRPRDNFDTGLSFGDYYFVEALLRHRSPPLPPDEPSLEVRVGNGEPAGRRLRATVEAGEAGVVKAALLARPGAARKLDLRSSGSGILGRGRARLEAPGEAVLRVRIDRRTARRLRELDRAAGTLSVVFRTADGRSSAAAVPIHL
jgi:unsaturated chondroitin disaccharide hydrolase